MSDLLPFDEEGSARIEAIYTTPDVVAQRRQVRVELALRAGEHVLDIGCGPGLLACEMAADVGPNGRVVGVDPSESMLAIAQRRASRATREQVSFTIGEACALPAEDASYDAAAATQVYEYLDDVPGALTEARRVLRPEGRLVVLDTDWDSIVWHSSEPERMRRVLAAWAEHLVDPYLPRRLPRLLRDAGFTLARQVAIPMLNAGYHANTFSAGLIGVINTFVPGRQGLTAQDASDWMSDLLALGEDYFFSLNRYLFVATAPV
jgi:arsenite methyltransferase